MEEKWKDIQGYEGLYQVSNLGRVRSFSDKKKGGFLSLKRKDRGGYIYVVLCRDGIHQTKKVHRLVAEAFLSNPEGLPFINHKDEVKTNNRVDNLEFCTQKYNVNYGTGIQKAKDTRQKNKIGFKPVYAFKDGVLVAEYDSITEAARQMGTTKNQIWSCCKRINKSCCNLQWSYEPVCPKVEYKEQKRRINCFTIDGKLFKVYDSLSECERQTGASRGNIWKCCRGQLKHTKGYQFSYADDVSELTPNYALKPVYCYTVDGELVNRFDSPMDAAKALNLNNRRIAANCRGQQLTYAGYKFTYQPLPNHPTLPVKR